MDRLNQAEWIGTEVVELPVAIIDTEDHLQARSTDALPMRKRAAAERSRENHTKTLWRTLEGGPEVQLEAIWVAQVDDRLLLVDGHHRLHAYHAAKRTMIPARVRRMTIEQAVVQARRVNLGDRRLPLEPDQLTELVWQELGRLSHSATLPREALPSCRKLAAEFGISKSSADRMLSKLYEVNLSQYSAEALDPWSKWPRWKYLRAIPENPLNSDQRRAKRIVKIQRALLKAVDGQAPDEVVEAYEGLIADDIRFAYMADAGVLPAFPEGPSGRSADF